MCGKGRNFSTIGLLLIVSQILIIWNHVVLCSHVDHSHGFGHYNWMESLEAAEHEAKATGKPIMVIIHKSWCSSCRYLKPKFAESNGIKAQSHNFVMVSLEDESEPNGEKYGPDGKYYPRILFYTPHGDLINVVNSHGSKAYKYYYPDPEHIVDSMIKVINSKTHNYSTEF